MIKNIVIEHVKGIESKSFPLNIIPNKPSLLVAPNGFGKSSIATAFKSLNNNRIALHHDDFHAENMANSPKISIEYLKPDGTTIHLSATHTTNTISSVFACYVISNITKPKGIGSQYGRATATLEIKDVVLVDRIPTNVSFDYSIRTAQARFGVNSKVLPNANAAISNLKFVELLSEKYISLQRANGDRIQRRINEVIDDINSQQGTTDSLIDWITKNLLNRLSQINYLNTIANFIHDFDLGFNSKTESYLVAIQLIWLYNNDPTTFRNACTYCKYKLDKQSFDITLSTFDCTWKDIRTTETQGKLVVKFPKAIHISNGERDILCFISMLFRAKRILKKDANILIIDEVFDYLDDANLTAAQYYVSTMINEFKERGKEIYPLLLTHLNPNYFKNFTFSKQKVYYLDKSSIQINAQMIKLLKNRDHNTIKDDVSKHLLHYSPETISKRDEFRALSLPELWGVGTNFAVFLYIEVGKYLSSQPYDPFAVCGGVRLKIEEVAYNKLQSVESRIAFINTHKTRRKLEKAEEKGIVSPESHYLLGIIYNEGMHWRDNQDNVTPLISKLENLTIRKLIADVFA